MIIRTTNDRRSYVFPERTPVRIIDLTTDPEGRILVEAEEPVEIGDNVRIPLYNLRQWVHPDNLSRDWNRDPA